MSNEQQVNEQQVRKLFIQGILSTLGTYVLVFYLADFCEQILGWWLWPKDNSFVLTLMAAVGVTKWQLAKLQTNK